MKEYRVSNFEAVVNIIFDMNLLSFLIFSSVLPAQIYSNEFLVTTQILNPPNEEEIVIKVEVKNISDKTIKTAKNLLQYFKWDKGENIFGNYIIEIEKYENEAYNIFSPSADIDPFPQKEEYVSIQNGQSIIDTFQIKGYLFSRYGQNGKGFPVGLYRLRVYFNPSWMGQEKNESCSKWVEFKIE